MDYQLLDVLACPVCKGKLVYDAEQDELICRFDHLAYAIIDHIPVMVVEKARHCTD